DARPGQDRRDLDRVLVEALLPPQAVLADLLAVVGGVEDERVLVQAVLAQRGQDLADQGVEAVDEAVVGGPGARDPGVGHLLDAALTAPAAVVWVRGRLAMTGRRRAAGVAVVVLASCDERLMRQHEADREAERLVEQTSPTADAEPVQAVDRRRGDVLVVDLVGAL